MAGYRTSSLPTQWGGVLVGVVIAGWLVLSTVDVEMKYKLAAIVAIGVSAFLVALPERQIACVVLWVLIHPLSVEKVFFVQAAEGAQFGNPTVVINMSDFPLVLLALFLVADTLSSNRSAFRWSRLTTVLLVFLVWSLVSYAVHTVYLNDPFRISAPYALLQDIRLLVFALLMQSAIRTRGDVILVLLAVAASVLMQTLIVGLSYSTGQLISYAATTAGADRGNAVLQGFDTAGGGEMLRGTGTVGQVNEQAIFHVVMTFPIIAFLAARNGVVRFFGAAIAAASSLAIVLTFSRGAWLAFPVGVVVCLAIAVRRRMMGRKSILAGALLGMAGCVVLLALAQPIYQRVVYGDNGATGARVRLLELAADLFKAYPAIGVGPGEFDEAGLQLYPPGSEANQWAKPGEETPSTAIGRVEYSEVRLGDFFPYRRPLPVHNKFMLVLSELGLPGLLIWLWLYIEYIRAAWRCSKLPDSFRSLLGVAATGAAAAQLAYMMVEHFHDDKPLEFVLLGPAIIFAALRSTRVEQTRIRRAFPLGTGAGLNAPESPRNSSGAGSPVM